MLYEPAAHRLLGGLSRRNYLDIHRQVNQHHQGEAEKVKGMEDSLAIVLCTITHHKDKLIHVLQNREEDLTEQRWHNVESRSPMTYREQSVIFIPTQLRRGRRIAMHNNA